MKENKVILRDYSKVIFMYPTLIISIIGWIIQAMLHIPLLVLEVLWVIMFFSNLFVVAFDFNPTQFIILMFVGLFLGAVIWFFILVPLETWIMSKSISFGFTVHFYILMTAILFFMFIIAILKVMFNYYIIERNELYHRIGIFARSERYAISNVSFDKDIPDIFEFLLFGAGSITFYPEGGRRLIKLNTVVRINKKEEKLNILLSKILVEANKD